MSTLNEKDQRFSPLTWRLSGCEMGSSACLARVGRLCGVVTGVGWITCRYISVTARQMVEDAVFNSSSSTGSGRACRLGGFLLVQREIDR
eukprot:scaffold78384_cov75-Phaeocystis_antarctica.AAC.1